MFYAIAKRLNIKRLVYHFKKCIAFCLQYRKNKIARHLLYSSIRAITVAISHNLHSFILVLPASGAECFNSILTITDKFSKAKLFILGRYNMAAKKYAARLLDYLMLCNWSISRATITDQDLKFQLELWKKFFSLLKVDLLVNIAYYPQANGLSKRINQTVEIAF